MGGGVSKRRSAYVKRQVGERVAAAGESAAESAARWAKEDEEAWRQDAAAVVFQALCRTRFALKAAEHRRAVRAYHMQVRLSAWVRQWQQRRRFLWAKKMAIRIQRRVRRGWGGTEGERRPPGKPRPWRQRTPQSRWQWWDVQGAEVEVDPEQIHACGRLAEKLEALWLPGSRAGFTMDERDLLKLVREAHQEGVHGYVNPDLLTRRAEAVVAKAQKDVKRAETMMEVASSDGEKDEAKTELAEAAGKLAEAKEAMRLVLAEIRGDDEEEGEEGEEEEEEEWDDEVDEDDDTPAPIAADEVDVPRELILREEDKAWRALCYQDCRPSAEEPEEGDDEDAKPPPPKDAASLDIKKLEKVIAFENAFEAFASEEQPVPLEYWLTTGVARVPEPIEVRALDVEGQRQWWEFERVLRLAVVETDDPEAEDYRPGTEPGTALRQAYMELYWWMYIELPIVLRDCPDDFEKKLQARRDYLVLLRKIPRFAPETRQLSVTGYGTNEALHTVLKELEEILRLMQVRLREEEDERRKRRSAQWMNPPTVMVVRWWRTVRGAAIHLQAAWREYVAKCEVQVLREARAVLWLQSVVRMYDVKRKAAFKRYMVLPHVARTESAVFIQRAYRRMRALERWEYSRQLPIQWHAAIKVQKVFRGVAVRKMQKIITQDIAHRVLKVLKMAGLPHWKIWSRYALTGLTYDRFLNLAVLPGLQLGGEMILDELQEQAARCLASQLAVVKERKLARMEHLQTMQDILASDGWSSVQVACTLFDPTKVEALQVELLAGPRDPVSGWPRLPPKQRALKKAEDDASGDGWLNRMVEKKVKSTHPYGTIDFGDQRGTGEWVAKKHAKDMDMYEEVAWLKRQELALKEWERLRVERLATANNWVGVQIEKRMHGMFQYGVPDEDAVCEWLYQREWTNKEPPTLYEHGIMVGTAPGLDLYEHAAWLKKQRLAGEAWVAIQEEAGERRRVEEERLMWLERNANEPEPEPEPETKQTRWKKMASSAVTKGTLTGVMAAAAAAKREQSRRLAWGIKASDRYRLATVLREERPKWEKKKKAQAMYQLGLIADKNRVAATKIQSCYRALVDRKRLRSAGESTENQTRQMLDRVGVAQHADRFIRLGFVYERLLMIRENQLGEDARDTNGKIKKVAPRYKVLAAGVVRQGKEMDSEKAQGKGWKLKENQIITVLEEAILDDGTVRLRFAAGWTSLRAKSGKEMLAQIPPEPEPVKVSLAPFKEIRNGTTHWKFAMARWGMEPMERARVMKALGIEKAKWDRSKKMLLMKKNATQRRYNQLEKQVKNVFDAVDTDGSGEIDKQEFSTLMVALGIGMSKKQLTETWRWMDTDRGGAIGFEEFFRWWKANRDGAEARGLIAGGGLSQGAEQSGVTEAKSITAFQSMFDNANIEGAELTSALDRMKTQQRLARPIPKNDVIAEVKGDGHKGGLRWSAGGTKGSNVVLSNASTLAYMGAHGGQLDWENPKDISVPGQRWSKPLLISERGNPLRPNSANMSEWIGGANEERRQVVAAKKAKEFIPVNPRVKVGRRVRVLWEETARAAVERCTAIETGWTDERASRCGQEGEVRAVDPDGTCRIHFQPVRDDRLDYHGESSDEDPVPEPAVHEGFGYGASVVKLANDAVKDAARLKKKHKEERALKRRVRSGESLREEALWFPVDAVEPTQPHYPSDDEDGPDASTAYAMVASGGMGVSRVTGYEISGCHAKPQINGSYDIGRIDQNDPSALPEFRQTSGEHWMVWHAVGYGGGQWFIGEAVGLERPGHPGGTPGGANVAFALGPKEKPAPLEGWFASKLPQGNGGYVPEDKMVVRALLADDGAVKAISEVKDANVRQSWVQIGAGTRAECVQTLKRLGCLGGNPNFRVESASKIAAVEGCRNRLRQAGEVAQSFGDAEGWAGALNLQAECCSALGKDRLVGQLKLQARSVLESAKESAKVQSPPKKPGRQRPATANAIALPALGTVTKLGFASEVKTWPHVEESATDMNTYGFDRMPVVQVPAANRPHRPTSAMTGKGMTGRPSTAPTPAPETLMPPPPPPERRPVTAEGGSRRQSAPFPSAEETGFRPRTADGGLRPHGKRSGKRRPKTAKQLASAYETLPSAVPTMMW